ncbi:MAG: hypothetical protein KDB03_14590 [Planctomycetales bacterium]|nr:hypothetical protein [Planctomycetales bacterium]
MSELNKFNSEERVLLLAFHEGFLNGPQLRQIVRSLLDEQDQSVYSVVKKYGYLTPHQISHLEIQLAQTWGSRFEEQSLVEAGLMTAGKSSIGANYASISDSSARRKKIIQASTGTLPEPIRVSKTHSNEQSSKRIRKKDFKRDARMRRFPKGTPFMVRVVTTTRRLGNKTGDSIFAGIIFVQAKIDEARRWVFRSWVRTGFVCTLLIALGYGAWIGYRSIIPASSPSESLALASDRQLKNKIQPSEESADEDGQALESKPPSLHNNSAPNERKIRISSAAEQALAVANALAEEGKYDEAASHLSEVFFNIPISDEAGRQQVVLSRISALLCGEGSDRLVEVANLLVTPDGFEPTNPAWRLAFASWLLNASGDLRSQMAKSLEDITQVSNITPELRRAALWLIARGGDEAALRPLSDFRAAGSFEYADGLFSAVSNFYADRLDQAAKDFEFALNDFAAQWHATPAPSELPLVKACAAKFEGRMKIFGERLK